MAPIRKFTCPHCAQQHLIVLDRCPQTGESISDAQKLEGVVLADRYQLIRRISEGGMGVVYEGKHIKLGRRVAVKMLHPHLRVSPETMKRFENEARLAASIGHRAIVDVIDLGRHQGLPYFVMEYLEGQGLNEILDDEQTLPVAESVDICMEMLEGLRAVHAKGIVHRDLKPGNIMLVAQPGGTRQVKVLDFGICRLQDPAMVGELQVTHTGSVFGTPRYMSPEQASGAREIDHRTDLYSAGVILYRMVSGGFPFCGENYNALLHAISTSEAIPPRSHKPTLPEGLEAIVLRAIAREPADRYQDANDFIEALAPYSSRPHGVKASHPHHVDRSADPMALLRPTIPAPPLPVVVPLQQGPEPGQPSTATNWDSTGVRGSRHKEFTWILPVAITVFSVAIVGVAATLWVQAHMARQQREIEKMTRLISASDRVTSVVPSKQPPGPETELMTAQGTAPGDATAAQVRFDIAGLPEGSKVEMDGKPLPQLPILVAPSGEPHAIRIEAPGFHAWQQDVLLIEDTTVTVELKPLTHKKKTGGDSGVVDPPIDTTYPHVLGKQKPN